MAAKSLTPIERLHLLERAEKILGRKKIAESLKVSEETVQGWSEDTLRLSHTTLIRLSDLLAKYAEGNKK
jgi:predicted transcriptional regulator